MYTNRFFYPFIQIAGFKALLIGASSVVGAGMIGYYTQTRFDGILNVHSGVEQAKWLYVLEPLTNILIVSLWFALACKLFSKKSFRLIDIIGTQYYSFIPMAPLAFLGIIKAFDRLMMEAQNVVQDNAYDMNLAGMDIFIISIVMLVTFFMVCWSGWLMYSGLKISANLKHKVAIPIFISGLIVGNLVPKLIF
jgi:hypothetical protein